MKCEFSELSFTFCVMHDFLNLYNSLNNYKLTPIFPTQIEENKHGYDVKLQCGIIPIFFQFKVSEKIIKSNGSFWNYHRGSYFKFNLYDPVISNQHNTLVDLAQNPANQVYYCAPLFNQNNELSDCFSKQTICSKTLAIDCQYLNSISSGRHCISCSYSNDPIIFMHSQVFKINNVILLNQLIEKRLSTNPVYKSNKQLVTFIKNQVQPLSSVEDNLVYRKLLIKYGIITILLCDNDMMTNDIHHDV